MKKRVLVLVILFLIFLFPIISAGSVDSEMQKITHYAEEYEIGNINYVRLMLYVSSAREGLNEILGAKSKHMGGVLKQEEIQKVLGEPNEQTKWVWVEGENHDEKLDESVPVWRKIVFDGKKIQIRMEAHPSIFKKSKFEEGFNEDEMPEEGNLIYRLHFETEFKKPEEQLDIQGKIDNIEQLAKSGASMETLAKESVNAEMIFNNYFRQGGGKCEDIMKAVFGSENQRQTQKILLNEIEFCEGETFQAVLRLEMCDECEWNYINANFRLESRGRFKHSEGIENDRNMKERYKSTDESSLMSKSVSIIENMQSACQEENFDSLVSYSNELRTLNEAWNEKANDVWEQIEKPIEQPEGNEDPYWWIKQDQGQRQKAEELRKRNYDSRKEFYLELFSGYGKQEYYFEQTDFEKRLIEEFKERGEEICNNNQDDNDNEQVDCYDSQCGGKVCGKGLAPVAGENGTDVFEVDYYCIAGTCQAKEIINESQGPVCGNNFCEQGEEICSSSVIDCGNETECSATMNCGPVYCPQDCVICQEHPPIECSGRVEFSGENENGCPLPPVCIEEKAYCDDNSDCPQPLCGVSECVKDDETGICKVTELTLCGQEECKDGEKQIEECDNEEKLVIKVCIEGMWEKTGNQCGGTEEKVCCQTPGPVDELTYKWKLEQDCQSPEGTGFGDEIVDDSYCKEEPKENCYEYCKEEISDKTLECFGNLKISGSYPDCSCKWVCNEIVSDECITKEDCGGENDVCSNGKCETLPAIIKVEPEEQKQTLETEEESIEEIGVEEEIEEESAEIEETIEKPESEPEQNNEESLTTGEVIFGFFRTLLSKIRITGYAVEEGTEESSQEETQTEQITEEHEPSSEPDNDCADKWKACGGPCPPCDYEQEPEEDYRREYDEGYQEDWESRDNEEREMHEKEQRQRCEKECARPCVEKCIRENCGEQMDCNIDEESRNCEGKCSPDESCIENCMSGDEDWWKDEFEDEHQEEKGVFMVGGGCRTEQGRKEGYIWFGGWGEPFGQIEQLKRKYYEFGDEDWCKQEINNLIKQRKEFKNGFNQEFAVWFFEKYLPNSAKEWEQAVSGIFELYWNNVDSQMRLAHTMQCLKKSDMTEIIDVNLINIEYETEYGKLEYWEELMEVDLSKIGGGDGKATLISPYMKVWVFPPKEFIKYEMQQSMENGEFPGPSEEKLERENEDGLREEEKRMMRQDESLMRNIRELSDKYGGDLDFVIQFKDYESNEIVFNLYAQINEQDIMKVEPMPPSEVPEEDVRVELDFEILYEMIFESEKEMRGEMLESPPWDRKIRPIQKVKDAVNGMKMYFKMRKLMGSAKYYPENAEGDVEDIFKKFFKGMFGRGPEDGKRMEKGEDETEESSKIGESPEGLNQGAAGKAVWIS